MKTRRTFLKTAGVAALSAWAAPFAQAANIKNIGIQLYTLRDVIEKDLRGIVAQLDEMGYKELEAYGIDRGSFFGIAPAEFKKFVSGLGMKVVGSHAMPDVKFDKNPKDGLDAVAPNWKKCVETAKTGGLTYITCPWWKEEHRKTADDFKKSAAILNLMGEYATQQGLKFTYHNHDFEFKTIANQIGGGKDPNTPDLRVEMVSFYDMLLKNTNPKAVNFEMDLYWV
nr:sugar phosphate isomerase/epimerase [Cytophagales bacterium]